MPRLLKSLELNGFKSFAQRTTFDLSHGITAIVGPNGSGKSNIIDAIRWLLGEREAKNLRGGKGEDLIFAGTSKRARVSLAQASLHFDNHGKFFPLEFAEIAVGRQVNRDGENQYFINKSEVRLKDVIDFFARARLGARGLVVVTQGNSDMFIRATPLERREMIEEMLGLREYQLKRLEAERRLKNTQINLDKVRALTEEVLPHLRSLKRQTSRWEKREALEQELRELENSFFGSEYASLHTAVAAAEKSLAAHEKSHADLVQAKDAAEAHLKNVESSQPEERKEIRALKEQTQAIIEKRSMLQKELGRLEAELERPRTGGRTNNPEPPAGPFLELLERIKTQLEEFFHKDPEEMQEVIEAILNDIDDVVAVAKKHTSTFPSLNGRGAGRVNASDDDRNDAVAKQFKKITSELGELEEQLRELKDREAALEKNQEAFYGDFKAAVAAFEAAKDALDAWSVERQKKEFERERVKLQYEEWERQVRAAGRRPEEFSSFPKGGAPTAGGAEDFSSPPKVGGVRGGMSDRQESERRMLRLRGDLASIGEVDTALVKEAQETETRYEFLKREAEDLEKAKKDLYGLIDDLNEKLHTEFSGAMVRINKEFEKFFEIMFGGGQGKLKLQKSAVIARSSSDEAILNSPPRIGGVRGGMNAEEVPDAVKVEEIAEPEEPGIEVEVKLPRKKVTSLGMLSGGERSLVGIAALFALVSVSPPPFLVLDEIDAPLDESNARRFADMLKEFSKETQFIVVTHNRTTMEAADILYGITMSDDDTSKVVSLKLE